MANVKETAVALSGTVMSVEKLTNFETKEYDGLRVAVGDGEGITQVKLSVGDAAAVAPAFMQPIAWRVRYGAWAGRGKEGAVTCSFVKVIDSDDLDKLVSASRVGAPSK